MEAVVTTTILLLLIAAAARFGHDSRDSMRTKEYDLAAAGMTWARHDETSAPSGVAERYSPPAIDGVETRLAGGAQPVEVTAPSI